MKMRKQEALDAVNLRISIFRFLADVFLRPIAVPGRDFVDGIFMLPLPLGDMGEEYAESDYKQGGALLAACAVRYAAGNVEEMQREIAVDRTRLCRGISRRPTEPPPPYEALYLSPQKEAEHLLKVVTFYRKAGLKLGGEVRERMDYLGIELAFMAEICDRERRAIKRGGAALAAITSLEKEFLEEHLLRWVPDYCRLVAETAHTDFFRGIARLLRGFLQEELDALQERAS